MRTAIFVHCRTSRKFLLEAEDGRVCMDMTMVDVTECTTPVKVGDEVVLLGPGIGAEELAAWAGTIPYEILTGWSGRVPRSFQGSAKTA